MTEALAYIYYIFNKFVEWIYNEAVLFPGVSLGWIISDGVIFAMLIRSLLNIPTASHKNSPSAPSGKVEKASE